MLRSRPLDWATTRAVPVLRALVLVARADGCVLADSVVHAYNKPPNTAGTLGDCVPVHAILLPGSLCNNGAENEQPYGDDYKGNRYLRPRAKLTDVRETV